MATVQEIIDAGFGLSRLSRPELIGVQVAPLIKTVHRCQQVLFQFAARVNPLALSGQTLVPFSNGGWERPGEAESVFRIEGAGSGTTPAITGEVLVVPYDDRAFAAGAPAVYRLGPRYFGAGNAGDPTGGDLTFFYAKRARTLSALADQTDPLLPEPFLPILEYEVAAFNARADGGREGELETMVAERNRYIATFEAWLEHETLNESRRFGEVRRFPTERRAPLDALVQAGQ